MIRQNDSRDTYSLIHCGSIISYPSGKKHTYKDYLVLGKSDDELTTVPILLQGKHKMNRFDLPLSDSLNADLGDEYFTSTLNVNTITKKDYKKVNPVHVLDLDPKEVSTHDQKTSVQIALIKKQYHSWLSIETSKVPITRKHQALRRGLNKHRILTKATLQKYLVGKPLTGSTENQDYNLATYIDQTYDGTIAHDDPNADLQRCYKYANVDKLRKYDVIRYKAITGDRVKWRPFVVMGQNGKDVDLVPITHNRHSTNLDADKGLYTIYHVNLSPKISKAVSIMNGDGREQAESARSALSPCTQISVSLDTFKRNQLPQYLGSLRDYVSENELVQMEAKKNESITSLMKSYESYQIEQAALGRVRNYQTKLYNRQSISERDLQKIVDKQGSGPFRHQLNLSPIVDNSYLQQKADHKLIYGVYQSINRDKLATIRKKEEKRLAKADMDEMEV